MQLQWVHYAKLSCIKEDHCDSLRVSEVPGTETPGHRGEDKKAQEEDEKAMSKLQACRGKCQHQRTREEAADINSIITWVSWWHVKSHQGILMSWNRSAMNYYATMLHFYSQKVFFSLCVCDNFHKAHQEFVYKLFLNLQLTTESPDGQASADGVIMKM